jgi:hypothetical protein
MAFCTSSCGVPLSCNVLEVCACTPRQVDTSRQNKPVRQTKTEETNKRGKDRGMKFNQASEKNAYKGWDRYTVGIVVESFSKPFISLALSQAPFTSP